MAEPKKKPTKPPGPEAERLKLTGNWQEMVKHALTKPPPKRGWPKPKAKKK
ncbi:MAG: hypothetical protein ACT4P8_08005 [Betaproteobacteria bacterium]